VKVDILKGGEGYI
jgi:hypothetical protein